MSDINTTWAVVSGTGIIEGNFKDKESAEKLAALIEEKTNPNVAVWVVECPIWDGPIELP